MRSRSPFARTFFALAAWPLALAGCAFPAPTGRTSDVVADKQKFLEETFEPKNAYAAVVAAFAPHRPVLFRRLQATYDVESNENGKTLTRNGTLTLVNAGSGMVKRSMEFSQNGIPYRLNGALSYRNVIALRVQDVFYNQTNLQRPSSIRSIAVPPAGLERPVTGQEFAFDYKVGLDGMLTELPLKEVCKAGPESQASAIHPKLTGSAVRLDCELFGGNGQLVSRLHFEMLVDLGIATLVEDASSSDKHDFKLVDITVEK